jgi:putative Holliday junction resolvase
VKYLGLDLGSVTCGVAWSETGFIAGTYKTIRFQPDDYDDALDKVLEVIQEKHPDEIVLGLPYLLNDDIGERGQICLAFGSQLEKESGLPVHMQDERMTTVESEDILLEADVSRRKRKKVIDQMAAVAILQRYLDSLS